MKKQKPRDTVSAIHVVRIPEQRCPPVGSSPAGQPGSSGARFCEGSLNPPQSDMALAPGKAPRKPAHQTAGRAWHRGHWLGEAAALTHWVLEVTSLHEEKEATSPALSPCVPPGFGLGPGPDPGKGFSWPNSMEIFLSVQQRTASFSCLRLGRGQLWPC